MIECRAKKLEEERLSRQDDQDPAHGSLVARKFDVAITIAERRW